MHIVAFAGPSRPSRLDPAIDWRPPASTGDLVALVREPPDRVVLIDGYFAIGPAPWHKEILLLLEHGIPVIGAASMGALRAAELSPYGMIGIGAIFAAFQSGRLVADDEVAVLHAPSELNWRPLTEPLVNVRATILASVRDKVLRAVEARRLLDVAAGLNFRDRDWTRILQVAEPHIGADAIAALAPWLVDHRVDLKARDAAEAVKYACDGAMPDLVSFRTPRTTFVRRLLAHVQIDLPERN
jgi:hypothetical protein